MKNGGERIPQPSGGRADVKNVLHGLLLLFTELASGRPQYPPFPNVVPH